MKPVFKCDYCSFMGTEEEVKEHEPNCTENYDMRSCHTCKNRGRLSVVDSKIKYECEVGKDIPAGLEEIYCSRYEYDEITGKDLKEIIADIAIDKFIDRMYDDYMCDRVYESIKSDVKEIVKANSNNIIDRVVDKVSDEIIKKKSIVNEMPKKSEVANISKEWENYFVELIDKAIAKRFK